MVNYDSHGIMMPKAKRDMMTRFCGRTGRVIKSDGAHRCVLMESGVRLYLMDSELQLF